MPAKVRCRGGRVRVSVVCVNPMALSGAHETRLSLREYLGASLCALRLEAGYTRAGLAASLNVAIDDIAAVEQGRTVDCPALLQNVSTSLQASLSDLVDGYQDYCACHHGRIGDATTGRVIAFAPRRL